MENKIEFTKEEIQSLLNALLEIPTPAKHTINIINFLNMKLNNNNNNLKQEPKK